MATVVGDRQSDSVDRRLARLLDSPQLARAVPYLAPETLHQLIRRRGLEACGDLVAAATPAQLTSVLDLDLWPHAQPGQDERFDDDRFGEWLELLVDGDDAAAARTISALDTNLVITGLSRYIRVFDRGSFTPSVSSDDALIETEVASSNGLEIEVGGYVIRARRTEAWDAIVTLLVALSSDHASCFRAVLQGCRRLSNSVPEIDGLDDLLSEPAQQLHDVALEREARRVQQGYSTPADARAFLQMARRPRQRTGATTAINPLAAAYFRQADEVASMRVPNGRVDVSAINSSTAADRPDAINAIVELLTEAGLVPERPRALLEGAPSERSRVARMRRLMAYLGEADESAYLERNGELAFLANTLIAGGSLQSRAFTPQEASDAAVAVCNLGLEHVLGQLPDAFLLEHDLVATFESGWAMLHQDVSLFVAERLIAILADLRSVDTDVQRGLYRLRRELTRQRDAGTPWLAREALNVLAMLDMTAWVGVVGLLDECPVLPAAVTAILERQTGAVSPTAFEFISTTEQVGQVRAFMEKLPNVLLG